MFAISELFGENFHRGDVEKSPARQRRTDGAGGRTVRTGVRHDEPPEEDPGRAHERKKPHVEHEPAPRHAVTDQLEAQGGRRERLVRDHGEENIPRVALLRSDGHALHHRVEGEGQQDDEREEVRPVARDGERARAFLRLLLRQGARFFDNKRSVLAVAGRSIPAGRQAGGAVRERFETQDHEKSGAVEDIGPGHRVLAAAAAVVAAAQIQQVLVAGGGGQHVDDGGCQKYSAAAHGECAS
mmetsp:Transcript_42179/g.82743  ORF Transcript_42179/g.82743 Transcript_42179/m.82743 type:complete len:241 (+) Transcript_42179:219-941(+)